MNIKDMHQDAKAISTVSLFKTAEGNVTSIKIMADHQLKEHITKTPAILICVEGNVVFENENGIREKLKPGDYIKIEPLVKHWVEGTTDSQLILIK